MSRSRGISRFTACVFSLFIFFAAAARAASWPPPDTIETSYDLYTTYDFSIENPGWEALADGARVHVRVYEPWGQGPFPAVVFVPDAGKPAIVAANERWSDDVAPEMDRAVFLAEHQIAVILYNPPGRGAGAFRSSGQDDKNGLMGQDALARLLMFAPKITFIDSKKIGLCTYGAGLSAAAGALARYNDTRVHNLSVNFLIDVEGPWDDLELTGYTWDQIAPGSAAERIQRAQLYYQQLPSALDDTPETALFWSRREPATFAQDISVNIYQRMQFEYDHAQPPGYYAHALRMYEAMRAAGTPFIRYNGHPWNAELPVYRIPRPYPGRLSDHEHIIENTIIEIANFSGASITIKNSNLEK